MRITPELLLKGRRASSSKFPNRCFYLVSFLNGVRIEYAEKELSYQFLMPGEKRVNEVLAEEVYWAKLTGLGEASFR